MMKQRYQITENKALVRGVYQMELAGDTWQITAPGQFINIRLEGFYLRRPISICHWEKGSLVIIYKTVGEGTRALAGMKPGQELDILCPLGNGYDLCKIPKDPVIVGGGAGVPPMYGLTKALISRGMRPQVILGFNTKDEVFLEDAFKDLGASVRVTTIDGSYGTRGFVTHAMDAAAYVCACGPEPMLRAVWEKAENGQFSFEARMACGFGACMGCSCKTKYGAKRICKEGPVLEKEEILW